MPTDSICALEHAIGELESNWIAFDLVLGVTDLQMAGGGEMAASKSAGNS